jgi:hypothetical protein
VTVPKPRLEIVFRKGRPVAAFFHLKEGASGKTGRTIPIRPSMTAHYDDSGLPIGLELPLPTAVPLEHLNEALRELGSEGVGEADILALRTG